VLHCGWDELCILQPLVLCSIIIGGAQTVSKLDRVFKYQVVPDTLTKLPAGAHVLSCGAQGYELFVWALVAPLQERDIRVFGTGHVMPDPVSPRGLTDDDGGTLTFIGTANMMGHLVFHLFEHTA
jgi:hypothetical protein